MKVQVFFDIQSLDDDGNVAEALTDEQIGDLKESLINDGAELISDGKQSFTFNMEFITAPVVGDEIEFVSEKNSYTFVVEHRSLAPQLKGYVTHISIEVRFALVS